MKHQGWRFIGRVVSLCAILLSIFTPDQVQTKGNRAVNFAAIWGVDTCPKDKVDDPDLTIPDRVNGRIAGMYCAYGVSAEASFGQVEGAELNFADDSVALPENMAQSNTLGYTYQKFNNGIIFNNRRESTAFALFNDILFRPIDDIRFDGQTYWSLRTMLGFPISSQLGGPDNCRAYFEKGYLACSGKLQKWAWSNNRTDRFDENREYQDLPLMKMPFNHDAAISYTSGPHNYEHSGKEFLKTKEDAHSGSGIDMTAGNNAEVLAVASGTIIEAGCEREFGCNIAIRSDSGGVVIVYGHVKPYLTNGFDKIIAKGVWVKQGEPIGQTALVGSITGQHVHLELRDGSKSSAICTTKPADKDCRWGNPIGWDGVVIDNYLITEFTVPDTTTIYNYDGGAIRAPVDVDATRKHTHPIGAEYKILNCKFIEGPVETWVTNGTNTQRCDKGTFDETKTVFAGTAITNMNAAPPGAVVRSDTWAKLVVSGANLSKPMLISSNTRSSSPSPSYRPYPGAQGNSPLEIPGPGVGNHPVSSAWILLFSARVLGSLDERDVAWVQVVYKGDLPSLL